jgi:hypothetical protein
MPGLARGMFWLMVSVSSGLWPSYGVKLGSFSTLFLGANGPTNSCHRSVYTARRFYPSNTSVFQLAPHTRPTHILVVSDPQVKHPGSLSWFGALRQSITHSTLRKNWSVASRLNPQAIVCLGDMLASGRMVTSDHE